jgi:hypothetical protein
MLCDELHRNLFGVSRELPEHFGAVPRLVRWCA